MLSFANIEEIPDNKPPRYTSCCFSPPLPLPPLPPPPPPPIRPSRNLKNDPPQVGEFYLPLSPPNVLGGGHCYRYYISFLYIYIICHIFFELGWFYFRNAMEAQKHEIWIKEYDLPSRAFTVSKRGLKIAFVLLQSKKNFITLYSDGNLPYFISF